MERLVMNAANRLAKYSNVLARILNAVQGHKVELFDGCLAHELAEAGVTTLEEAYAQGFIDGVGEIKIMLEQIVNASDDTLEDGIKSGVG